MGQDYHYPLTISFIKWAKTVQPIAARDKQKTWGENQGFRV